MYIEGTYTHVYWGYLKKGVVRWDLEGPISSGYLAHCSHTFFMSIRIDFSASYSMLSQSCDTNFAGQVLYKPWSLSMSSEALVPIIAILIPAADRASAASARN